MKFGNINLQGLGELQNANIQNLASAPTTNLKKGRIYFDTSDNTLYIYDGTSWKDALSQGVVYQEGNGIDITGNVISTDLTANDIPSLPLSKISDVTASASEVNILDGVTVSTAEINSIPNKIELTDLSIDSGSSNFLGYDNTTGEFSISTAAIRNTILIKSDSTNYIDYNGSSGYLGLNVDTTVTENSTKLITSGAVYTAIDNALVGGMVYKGVWTATGQTDYSSITLPVKAGYMYLVSGSATIGGIEWNTDDYLVINSDVPVGGTITNVKKIDNTEGSDIVRLNASQTLTNKTIDADDNTISDLTTSNFKSGTVVTSVGATGSDTSIPTEKAVRSAINGLTYSVQNSALTQSGGVCTFTVTHNLNTTSPITNLYEVATGEKVMYDVAITSANVVTYSILSASNIAANTYLAVVQK